MPDGEMHTAAPASQDSVLRLELDKICKRFGGTQALRDATLRVRRGSIHGLIGENGAGKSTLIKVISGAVQADSGVVCFDGEQLTMSSTKAAMRLGVETVYQEPHLFKDLTVAENIFIGREMTTRGNVDWRETASKTELLLERMGLLKGLASAQVAQLTIAEQQQISIAKALARNAKLLILDEPSAILSDAELHGLFALLKRLVAGGESVIYVTHRLDELPRIADEVTVMRDGATVATLPAEELSVREMAQLMIGSIPETGMRTTSADLTRPVLEVRDLTSAGSYRDVNFTLHAGEVICLYGLTGSGAADVAGSLYSLPPVTSGCIRCEGQTLEPMVPASARQFGISVLPGDRKLQGIFAPRPISFNLSISHLKFLRRGLVLDRRKEREIALDMIRSLAVRAPGPDTRVDALSGGNAQKVVMGRQLVQKVRLLVLIEPTQGVDIGAKEEIHRLVEDVAHEGAAVLVATTDHVEASRLGDRILVLRGGAVVASFASEAEPVNLVTAASGDGTGGNE